MKRTLIFTVLCVLLSGCIMDSFYLSTARTDDSTFFAHENGRFNDYIIGEWFKIEKKGNDIFVWVSENDKKTKRNLKIDCTGAFIQPVVLHQLPK